MKILFCFIYCFSVIRGCCSSDEDTYQSNIHCYPHGRNGKYREIAGKSSVDRGFKLISDNHLVLDKYTGTESASFLLATRLHMHKEDITEINFFSSFITSKDLVFIAKIKGLHKIVFVDTEINKEDVEVLKKSLITEIVLCDSECLPDIVDSLFLVPSLLSLTLDRICFEDFYSHRLAENTSLKKLVISSVPLGINFIKSINENKSLETVAIYDGVYVRCLKHLFTRKIEFFR